MIKITQLKVGEEVVKCGQVNLILGSNNTGKSRLLGEILSSLEELVIPKTGLWLSEIEVETNGTRSAFEKSFPRVLNAPDFDSATQQSSKEILNLVQNLEWNRNVFDGLKSVDDDLRKIVIDHTSTRDADYYFKKFIFRLKTKSEFCSERLDGPFETTIQDIAGDYRDIVHFLYANETLFSSISRHISRVFGFEIAFDDLEQGRKHIRLKPQNKINRSLPNLERARLWSESSKIIGEQGDGIKAYLRIIFSLFSLDRSIVLIDEPEAFLHPPQRRSLGRFISENARQEKQIFIATHDSEFLRGILINPPPDLKIIHLSNDNGQYRLRIGVPDDGRASQNYNELLLNSFQPPDSTMRSRR